MDGRVDEVIIERGREGIKRQGSGVESGGWGGGGNFPQTDMEKAETEKQSELVKVPSQQKV